MFCNTISHQIITNLGAKKKLGKRAVLAIDGIDAAGKTNFSKQVKKALKKHHINAAVISLDDFHQPKAIRYQKGINSALGFYLDSYDYSVFLEQTIIPFKQQKASIIANYFNLKKDKIEPVLLNADQIDWLIVEGIFLHRSELISHWDYTIYLDITFEEALMRNIGRDKTAVSKKCIQQVTHRYYKRYKAGQLIYLEKDKPKVKAAAHKLNIT